MQVLGTFRYGMQLATGIVVGVACIWLVRAVGAKVVSSTTSASDASPSKFQMVEWKLRLLYMAAFAWLAASALIGFALSQLLPK
jgi:hypothetical protein